MARLVSVLCPTIHFVWGLHKLVNSTFPTTFSGQLKASEEEEKGGIYTPVFAQQ